MDIKEKYDNEQLILSDLKEKYKEIDNILSKSSNFNDKTKKHNPYIHNSKPNTKLITFENFIQKYKEFSFSISKELSIDEYLSNIRETLKRRYNLPELYSKIKKEEYIQMISFSEKVLSATDFKNCICRYTKQKDILKKFPYFKDKKTGRSFYKKVYTINTENSLTKIKKTNDIFNFCNVILICIAYHKKSKKCKEKYNIFFDIDNDTMFGTQLHNIDLKQDNIIRLEKYLNDENSLTENNFNWFSQ